MSTDHRRDGAALPLFHSPFLQPLHSALCTLYFGNLLTHNSAAFPSVDSDDNCHATASNLVLATHTAEYRTATGAQSRISKFVAPGAFRVYLICLCVYPFFVVEFLRIRPSANTLGTTHCLSFPLQVYFQTDHPATNTRLVVPASSDLFSGFFHYSRSARDFQPPLCPQQLYLARLAFDNQQIFRYFYGLFLFQQSTINQSNDQEEVYGFNTITDNNNYI